MTVYWTSTRNMPRIQIFDICMERVIKSVSASYSSSFLIRFKVTVFDGYPLICINSIPSLFPKLRPYCFCVELFQCSWTPKLLTAWPWLSV